MSSQRYANNLSVSRFAKSPPLSFAETSPSMYSQASLPRESWNSFMFPTNNNVGHKFLHRRSSTRTSRASSIELSETSSDSHDVTKDQSQATHDQSYALPLLEVPSPGNHAISLPRRLSRSSSATRPRPRRSGTSRNYERRSHARILAVPQDEQRIVSVCSTVASAIKYYSDPPTPPDIPSSTRSLQFRQEAPNVIWNTDTYTSQRYTSRPRPHNSGVNPARSLSTSRTSTYVESDLTAPTLSRVPHPTATPDPLRNKIQSGTASKTNRDLRTVQYSPYDLIITEVLTIAESESDEVPRWRRREAKGPALMDRLFRRRRASSLTSHRRRLGLNTMGEPTSFKYASSFSASVRSLPARFHSAVSLSTFSGGPPLKSRKNLKSRLLSIFSPSSFSLSKFSLLARRKRTNSTEELRSYIKENHPGIGGKAAGSSRTVSPRRAESLTGWVSSDFEIDARDARMTARSFGISDGTRPMPHGY